MLKTLDVKTQSITEAKKNLSKIIKESKETGEPTFIFNHNKPEAVILNNEVYEDLIAKYEELENQLFYNYLQNRVSEGPKELIPSKNVIDPDNESNPFISMSDEDLFS